MVSDRKGRLQPPLITALFSSLETDKLTDSPTLSRKWWSTSKSKASLLSLSVKCYKILENRNMQPVCTSICEEILYLDGSLIRQLNIYSPLVSQVFRYYIDKFKITVYIIKLTLHLYFARTNNFKPMQRIFF